MRGGVLGTVASAFRLRRFILSGEVSEGTAKHGLNDHHDIGHGRHAALARRLIDGLFSADYLAARGLSREEGSKHNELVAGALDATLSRWDPIAAFANALPEHFERIQELLGVEVGMSADLPVRLAAYDALYGYLHPCLPLAPFWSNGPGLKVWWASLASRALTPIQASTLQGRGILDPHTARDLRDGKALPKESTIGFLAEQLAAHGIRVLGDECRATSSELEFELRVAVGACEHGELVRRFTAPSPTDAVAAYFRTLRELLGRLPDAVTEDLLRNGTQSQRWEALRPALDGMIAARVQEAASAVASYVSKQLVTTALHDPKEASRQVAETCRERASFWRSIDERPGADGPDRRWAEWFEGEGRMWSALANGRLQEVGEVRAELAAELKADQLCMEAVAPWLKLRPEEQEGRLCEAVRICDSSSYAHRRLGLHLREQGRTEEAIQHLRRATEINPQNEESREALAVTYIDRGNFSEALAITDVPCSTTTLRAARAHALVSIGDVAAAEQLASGILEESPRHTMALRALAECYRRAGDGSEARKLELRADFLERGVRNG